MPPRALKNMQYKNGPSSSFRFFSGREVLLSDYRWVFAVSKMVLTPEFFALTENKRLRPNLGTIFEEIRLETRCPALSMMYPQIVPVDVANYFSLPSVTMVVGSLSPLKFFMMSCSLGTISSITLLPDRPLFTVIVALSALG